MTLLTKIRNKSGLLVSIIAIALLVFILESALESRKGLSNADRSKIAIINGSDVGIEEFQSKLDQAETNEKQRNQKTTIDEGTRNNLRMQVWNQILIEYVVQPRYAKIGLGVSTDELYDMVQGKDPHPQIKQAFTDEKTKQFSPQNVINFLKNMEKDETGDTKTRWLVFEAAIKDERVSQKYTNMIKKGLYITKAEAKRGYIAGGKAANFQFVFQNYASVPDSTINVSEDDMRKYYNENKNKYSQKETARGIDYVEFMVTPSSDDKTKLLQGLEKLKAEFAAAPVDSDFVNQTADTRYVDKYVGSKSGFMFFDSLSKSPIGTVVGPYNEGTSYKICKLSGTKMAPDSVKARHILISIEGGNIQKAKDRADSLKTAIKGGKKFEDLARIFSKDPGSGAKGGDLGWFKEGMMVKPFNDACFYGKVGDLQIVESQFGIHLIELMNKGKESPRLLIAVIDRALTPSTQTYQSFYTQASQFAGKNNTKELFEKEVKEKALNKRTAANLKEIDRNLNGDDNGREVVRWAFGAKKGDVSQVFQLGDKYLVAMLTQIKEKGTLPFEEVEEQIKTEAIKQKKADNFIAAMNAAKGSSLEQLAEKLKLKVEDATSQSFKNGTVGNYGRESTVLGKIYGMKPNVMSSPIKGDAGVFVVKVKGFTDTAANTDNYKAAITEAANAVRQRVDYEIFDALKEKAEVEDNRATFF